MQNSKKFPGVIPWTPILVMGGEVVFFENVLKLSYSNAEFTKFLEVISPSPILGEGKGGEGKLPLLVIMPPHLQEEYKEGCSAYVSQTPIIIIVA